MTHARCEGPLRCHEDLMLLGDHNIRKVAWLGIDSSLMDTEGMDSCSAFHDPATEDDWGRYSGPCLCAAKLEWCYVFDRYLDV